MCLAVRWMLRHFVPARGIAMGSHLRTVFGLGGNRGVRSCRRCAGMQVGLTMMGMNRTATGSRPLERRRCERATHGTCGPTRRGCGALELAQLTPEVCNRRVRAIFHPRTKHRGDEYCSPCCCYDEEDELCHVECGVVIIAVCRTPDCPER